MSRAPLPPVCSCDDVETDHELLGANIVGRPVWRCLECGERRTGPFAADRAADKEIATDGGRSE